MAEGNLLALKTPSRSSDTRRLAVAVRAVTDRVPLSRDTVVKWTIIVAMVAADAVLSATLGLDISLQDVVRPLIFIAMLSLPAIYYYRRGEPKFVLCLTTLVLTIAFLPPFTFLMYATATFGRPLVDGALAGFDQWCGVSVPDIREWTHARPALRLILELAYGTLLFQLPLIVIVLGLLGDRRRLEAFVLQDMFAALFTLLVFAVVPAAGPFTHYGYSPSVEQARYLDHFHGLRSGERRTVSLREAEGLVTCPSFHTAEALLMAWAFRRHRVLFALFGSLNLLVALSTMTTGWHYFADVLAGLAVGLLAVAVVHWATPWLHPSRPLETA